MIIFNLDESVYLIVKEINDIVKLEGRMALYQLLRGVQTPLKRKFEDSTQQVNLTVDF